MTSAITTLSELWSSDFEEVTFLHDPASGLKAVIALHDTSLGRALGGVRLASYPGVAEALVDACRLAHSMTNKCALAGLPAGGGKIVVLDHGEMIRTAAFEALGRHLHAMGGRMHTSRDLGTTRADMLAIAKHTRHITVPEAAGNLDLAQWTATGVFEAAGTCLDILGMAEWSHRRVAIQGLGQIGLRLANLLANARAVVIGCDIDAGRAGRAADTLPIQLVEPDQIYDVPCDVFAPCANGGIFDEATVARLQCRVIAGAANDQLVHPEVADLIAEKNILYVPDFVANSGAVIMGAGSALPGYSAPANLHAVAQTVQEILLESLSKNVSPYSVALQRAEQRWRAARAARCG